MDMGQVIALIKSFTRKLKSEINAMNTATASDVGKALSPKTVSNGKVTEWKFVSAGGGGGGSSQPYLTGDVILLGVNNYLGRSGQGEIVTTSMLRRAGVNL